MRCAKIDGNHNEIVDTFRACGCLVQSLARMGAGVPDLLVQHGGSKRLALVEVKTATGKPTAAQEQFYEQGWKVYVVRDTRAAIAVVQELRR